MSRRFVLWGLIGALLALLFGDQWYWVVFVTLFWLLGAFSLRRLSTTHLSDLGEIILTTRSPRVGLLLAAAGLGVIAWLFGAAASLLAFTVLASVVLLSVVRRGPAPALDLVTGLAVAGTTLLAAGFAGNWLVTRPSADWPSEAARLAQQAQYDSLARFGNMFGFRSPYDQVAKDSGVYRVFVLGDSFSWGVKTHRTADTWPARLEELLREARPESRIEVINSARSGWTTANQAELMRRLGWQFEPDLVVVQYYVNDIYESSPGFNSLDSEDVFRQYTVLPHRFRGAAAARSPLIKFLDRKVTSTLSSHEYAPLYADSMKGWQQLSGALEELGAEAKRRSVPAVLMILPTFPEEAFTVESHPHRLLYRKVEDVARLAGLEVFDMTPVFANTGRRGHDWWALPDDRHPSVEAHELIAHGTFEFLASREVSP